jgi:hypothetical protein
MAQRPVQCFVEIAQAKAHVLVHRVVLALNRQQHQTLSALRVDAFP